MQRKIDKAGRLRIPDCYFKQLEMHEYQEIEITIEYGKICIKKFERGNIDLKPYVGIVRTLDELYRVSIPSEYLKLLGIMKGDKIALELGVRKIKIRKID